MQGVHDRSTSFLPRLPSMVSRVTAYLSLDCIELADARQHLGGERRLRRVVELIEGPPHVRPTERQLYRVVSPISSQPLEPGIAIDLQQALEFGQVSGGTRALAVLGIDMG